MLHRWVQDDGTEHPDGSKSKWTAASLDFLRAAVCNSRPGVQDWFEARGITCESVLSQIQAQKEADLRARRGMLKP